jgi:hypothetical protein
MSVVIEAIIYPIVTVDRIDRSIDLDSFIQTTNSFNLHLKKYQFNNSTGIILHLSEDRTFDDNLHAIAQQVSIQTHKTLLILYDDRLGYRYSGVYIEGSFAKEFTSEDEVWVLVGEDYNPLLEREFSFREVDEDENENNEYITVCNSIELGLNEIGVNEKWRKIFDSILGAYRN